MTKPELIYDNSRNRVYSITPYNGQHKIVVLQKINGVLKPIFITLIPNGVDIKCHILHNYMNYPKSVSTNGISSELFASPQVVIKQRARRQFRLYNVTPNNNFFNY